MPNPSILIVILNYRTAQLSLQAAEHALPEAETLGAEIVIVDNDSRDGSFETMSAAVAERGWDAGGRVRVIQSGHNGGYGAGNNVGIRAGLSGGAAPDYVYLLNSDAWPDPGAIGTLAAYMEAHPHTGMAGSHVRGEDGALHETAFRFPSIAAEFEEGARTGLVSRLLRHRTVCILPPPATATEVDWVAGASLMMRRAMLDEIGLFDERFFLYFEETDLCRRARAAGWAVAYVPESRIVHIGSASTGMGRWSRTPGYWFDSRLHYYAKNHGRAYAFAATAARAAGEGLWSLRRLIQRNKPRVTPPGFLRDLVAHAFRAALGRAGGANASLGASSGGQ